METVPLTTITEDSALYNANGEIVGVYNPRTGTGMLADCFIRKVGHGCVGCARSDTREDFESFCRLCSRVKPDFYKERDGR